MSLSGAYSEIGLYMVTIGFIDIIGEQRDRLERLFMYRLLIFEDYL